MIQSFLLTHHQAVFWRGVKREIGRRVRGMGGNTTPLGGRVRG